MLSLEPYNQGSNPSLSFLRRYYLREKSQVLATLSRGLSLLVTRRNRGCTRSRASGRGSPADTLASLATEPTLSFPFDVRIGKPRAGGAKRSSEHGFASRWLLWCSARPRLATNFGQSRAAARYVTAVSQRAGMRRTLCSRLASGRTCRGPGAVGLTSPSGCTAATCARIRATAWCWSL